MLLEQININKKFDEDAGVPRSVGHIVLNTIDVSLSDAQIKSLMVLEESTKLQKLRFHYSRFKRPKESPKKDPKGWWNYTRKLIIMLLHYIRFKYVNSTIVLF